MDTNGDKLGSVLRQTTCNVKTDNQRFECDLEVRTIKRRRTDLCWMTGRMLFSLFVFGVLLIPVVCLPDKANSFTLSDFIFFATGETSIYGPGSLVQSSSYKCIHPNSGGNNVPDGTRLVMYSTCNEAK